MFCPKCKSILIPKRDGNKKMLVCSCGYKTKEIDKNLADIVSQSYEKHELNLKFKKITTTSKTIEYASQEATTGITEVADDFNSPDQVTNC